MLGWLSRLKDSARNSTVQFSRGWKRRCSAKSITSLPGPGRISRPALPNVYGAGSENALVLKKRSAVRWLEGKFTLCPKTTLGRFGVPELAKSVAKYTG